MNDRSPLGTGGVAVESNAFRRAAGLVCIGFEGTTLDARTTELLRDGVAGVVLFSRNFVDREQLATLCGEILDAADRNVIIAVDQEGGRVQRFRGEGFTDLPSARSIGELTGDPEEASAAEALGGSGSAAGAEAASRAATETATTAARELRAVGINLNFAPVLDVDSNEENPIIGDRSFGSDPEIVATLGTVFMRSLQRNGVAACGKHFPGHGDTSEDSHHDLPRVTHDRARLDAVELPPFVAAIDAGIASIMTAHVVYEALDAESPATLSRAVLQDLLRKELGFEGVIISDDLDMKAISERFEVGDAAVRAIDAGVDLLLCCQNPSHRDRTIEALATAISDGRLAAERVDLSLKRIDSMARTFS